MLEEPVPVSSCWRGWDVDSGETGESGMLEESVSSRCIRLTVGRGELGDDTESSLWR